MDSTSFMSCFLIPRSVALIGLSRATGEGSYNLLENLFHLGYRGRIYPVNPNAQEILGVRCYATVSEIPEAVDLAVILTPRELVPSVVSECTNRGIKAIIVVSQGFADADEKGKRLQQEISWIANQGGARIIGPNTFGTVNAFHSFSTAFMKLELKPLPIGLICQTGVMFIGFPGIRLFGKGIDLGNACDIDFADCVDYFGDDPEVSLIVLQIEGLRDGRRFMETARQVAKRKPIIALKTGRSKAGARAAQSHTGSLSGSDEVYNASFKQSGVIRVYDIEELGDLVGGFLHLPPMRGRRLAVASITGAGGIIAADACERYGLQLAQLSPLSLDKIAALSPPWMSIGNPVDMWPASMISGHPYDHVVKTTLEALLGDEGVDAVLYMTTEIESEPALDVAEAIFDVTGRFPTKPIVTWRYSPHISQASARLEQSRRVLVYPSCERAVRTLTALATYYERIAAPE
jgi:acyl-CoA synthetase (NDP forming)